MNNPIIRASGAIPAYACVKVSTSGSERVEVASSAADVVFGVTLAGNTADGGAVDFQTTDSQLDIFTLKAAGTIAIGQYVVPTTNGTVIGATTGPFVALDPATIGQTFTARKFNAGATANFLAPGTGATTRTLDSKLGDTISVKDFGAVGDGTTDDRAAIQTAINSCITLGKTLFFPQGTYAMSSFTNAGAGIQIDIPSPVGALSMAGDKATIKTTATIHAGYMFYIRGGQGKDLTLDGLTFDANLKSQCCFRHDEQLQSVTVATLNNCIFKNGFGLEFGAPAASPLWKSSTGIEFVGGFKFVNATNNQFLNFKRSGLTATEDFETTGMAVGINTEGPVGTTFPQNTNVSGCYFNDINNNQTAAVGKNANADGVKIFGGNAAAMSLPSNLYVPSTATVSNNHFINCQGRAIKIQNDESVVINNTIRYAVRPINGGSGQVNLQLEVGVITNNVFHYDVAPSEGGIPQNPFANALGASGSAPLGFYSGLLTTRPRMYTVTDNVVLNNVPEETGVLGNFTGWTEGTESTTQPVFVTVTGNKISGPLKIFAAPAMRSNSGGKCFSVIKNNMMAKLTHAFMAAGSGESFAVNQFEIFDNVNFNPTPKPLLVSNSDYTTRLFSNVNAFANTNIGLSSDEKNIQGRGVVFRPGTIADPVVETSAGMQIQTLTLATGTGGSFAIKGFHWSNSGLRVLVTNNGGSTNFVFMQNDGAISSISAGSGIAFGATDPGTAGKLSVFLGSGFPNVEVKLFNRVAATTIIATLFSFN
jgi:hypothetical protein